MSTSVDLVLSQENKSIVDRSTSNTSTIDDTPIIVVETGMGVISVSIFFFGLYSQIQIR